MPAAVDTAYTGHRDALLVCIIKINNAQSIQAQRGLSMRRRYTS